jgi:hypothetical protein
MTNDLSTSASRNFERWGSPVSLVLLACMAMGNVLPNAFTRDDLGIVVGGTLEAHWSGIIHAFGAAYWPPADSGELYRPLTIGWMTVQWQLGGGHPLLFRIVTLVLYAVATLSVWALLRRLVHPAAAWIGAALFAVHPVHVEAVVEAVSQSELIVASLLCWAVALHLDANAGRREVRWTSGVESLLFALALFLKENALVLPALLFAADALVDRGPGGVAERWQRWRAHYGAMILIAAIFWLTRGLVLGIHGGTHPTEAVEGGLLARTWTMVGVPAEWLRLLVWPARLQDEWSLLEWVPTKGWSLREVAGILAMGSVALAAVIAWRPRPHLTFGIVFMAIALSPVTNLLIPTGVVIAERTLFLPSVGFIVAISVLAAELFRPGRSFGPAWRRVGLAGFGLVLLLGMVRSALRLVDWRNPVIWAITSLELAPLSWRTHLAYASRLVSVGDTAEARREVKFALALRPDNPMVVKGLTDYGRLFTGSCHEATIMYEEVLLVAPHRSDARGSLVACLAYLGRYQEARDVALEGMRLGGDPDFYRVVAERAEQALRAHTPPGEWRVHLAGTTATDIGPPPP